ncbi:hypothetical protein BST61_g10367 [Cercospora zeina]
MTVSAVSIEDASNVRLEIPKARSTRVRSVDKSAHFSALESSNRLRQIVELYQLEGDRKWKDLVLLLCQPHVWKCIRASEVLHDKWRLDGCVNEANPEQSRALSHLRGAQKVLLDLSDTLSNLDLNKLGRNSNCFVESTQGADTVLDVLLAQSHYEPRIVHDNSGHANSNVTWLSHGKQQAARLRQGANLFDASRKTLFSYYAYPDVWKRLRLLEPTLTTFSTFSAGTTFPKWELNIHPSALSLTVLDRTKLEPQHPGKRSIIILNTAKSYPHRRLLPFCQPITPAIHDYGNILRCTSVHSFSG